MSQGKEKRAHPSCAHHGRIREPTRTGTCRRCAGEALDADKYSREKLCRHVRGLLRSAMKPVRRRRPSALATRRLKRSRPEGTSLRMWSEQHEDGQGWLDRKTSS